MNAPFSKYVRPIIALSLLMLIGYGFVTERIGAEYIMGLATGVIGSYFDSKSND